MKKEEFDKLPDSEKQHYNHCTKCNVYYDTRDHKQSQKHVHGINSDEFTTQVVEMTEL
ncbi:hypothetical protein [Polluticoccus soli]|uniref:hypothetical protein n=1 Tax=Polluticoccus soli TaxID=3034150 RepID=UPI0023E0E336|nr:hypothetical protein [Flavipsychrobacter sp. JY13-12]